jgi:hypothetical protein
MLDY